MNEGSQRGGVVSQMSELTPALSHRRRPKPDTLSRHTRTRAEGKATDQVIQCARLGRG